MTSPDRARSAVAAAAQILKTADPAWRRWPPGVRRFNSRSNTVSYVPVPALDGETWPLFRYCPPAHSERFVQPAILRNATASLFVHPMSFNEGDSP